MTKEDQEHSLEEHVPPSPDTLISFAAESLNFTETPEMQALRRKLVEEKDQETYLQLLDQYHNACEEIVDANNDQNRPKRQIGANLARAAMRAERQAWDIYRDDIADILDEADMSGFPEIGDRISELAFLLLPPDEEVER